LFGGGSPVALAVLGGIAAIGAAYKLMGLDAAEAKKQTEELMKELDNIGPHGKVVADQMRVDALIQQWDDLQRAIDETPFSASYKGASIVNARQLEQLNIEKELAAAQNQLQRDAAVFNRYLDERADKLNNERLSMDEFIAQHERIGEHIQSEINGMKNLEETLRDIFNLEQAEREGPVAVAVYGSQRGAGGIDLKSIDEAISKAIDQASRDLDRMSRTSEESAKRWGERISVALVDGITGKLNSLGDLMKAIIEEFIAVNIITPFLSKLKIFSPSGFGAMVGESLVQGIGVGMQTANLGPMGLRLDLNVNNSGAPADPFSAARDATWIRTLRESMLVSHSQGFRLPGQT